MKALIALILVSIVVSCAQEQKSDEPKTRKFSLPVINPHHHDEIGFKCGEGGASTVLVRKFSKLIRKKNYKQIRAGLYSTKPSMCYLATFSCEKLAERGLIQLNKNERNQINENKKNTESVFVCSGCTDSGDFTVKQLLTDTSHFMKIEAGWWFDEVLLHSKDKIE
jgi:hypothetical protein